MGHRIGSNGICGFSTNSPSQHRQTKRRASLSTRENPLLRVEQLECLRTFLKKMTRARAMKEMIREINFSTFLKNKSQSVTHFPGPKNRVSQEGTPSRNLAETAKTWNSIWTQEVLQGIKEFYDS